MNWNKLETTEQLNEIRLNSKEYFILIFKHSTRCSISRAALDRFERNWKEEEMREVKPYYLDLITYREISNRIAEDFSVQHESPQVLIIRNGVSVYDRSHLDIDFKAVKDAIAKIESITN
jgi:bacillithiol system protein YtxJ